MPRCTRCTARTAGSETGYTPAVSIGCDVETVTGAPDPEHISTRYVERQNWTVRTTMRRYDAIVERLQPEDREPHGRRRDQLLCVQLHQIHRTLRVSPAMAAGVTNRLLDVSDLVNLLVEAESKKVA
jgi:hypothetical protein